MLNTHMTTQREVPWWAIGAPAVGVPIMVALLALTAPKHEAAVDGTDLGATTEQVERQASSGFPAHCSGRPRKS